MKFACGQGFIGFNIVSKLAWYTGLCMHRNKKLNFCVSIKTPYGVWSFVFLKSQKHMLRVDEKYASHPSSRTNVDVANFFRFDVYDVGYKETWNIYICGFPSLNITKVTIPQLQLLLFCQNYWLAVRQATSSCSQRITFYLR